MRLLQRILARLTTSKWQREFNALPADEQARLKAIWHEQARQDDMEVW